MDETVAAMVEISTILHISKLIEHNSKSDFHLDMHTIMSGGFNFEGSEVFMHTTTQHLLNNMARAVECHGPILPTFLTPFSDLCGL